jgi:thioredoxin 2
VWPLPHDGACLYKCECGAAPRARYGIRLLNLDTEKAQDLAVHYGIRSIPTLALFKNGREVARLAGTMDAGRIVAWMQSQARTRPA